MSSYNFTHAEAKFIRLFFNVCQKVVYWKEYGPTEWYTMYEWDGFTPATAMISRGTTPMILPTKPAERKIIRMMLKLDLLVPEIESDKEYSVQRALGCVIGRIYYMPEEIREELKNAGI